LRSLFPLLAAKAGQEEGSSIAPCLLKGAGGIHATAACLFQGAGRIHTATPTGEEEAFTLTGDISCHSILVFENAREGLASPDTLSPTQVSNNTIECLARNIL
jgi:hypothetical protein